MRKTISTILIVLGLALIVAGISLEIFPNWLSVPGGILLLIMAAIFGVAELGGKLNDFKEFIFGKEEEITKDINVHVDKQHALNDQSPSEIAGNKMIWKNKILIFLKGSRIVDNLMIGENEILVGKKRDSKSKKE